MIACICGWRGTKEDLKIYSCPDCNFTSGFFKTDEFSEEEIRSIIETKKHIREVRKLLSKMLDDLTTRAIDHDLSKQTEPELSFFTKYTPLLSGLVYGSEEYKKQLEELKPALDHHYKNNSHHPEYHANGIKSMTLIDLCEMIADWLSATHRHTTGDIYKSLEINQKRFGYSDDLKQIFINTSKYLKGTGND